MHLLVRERVSTDEEGGAVDLDLPPADLVFLSFSDGDLASIETAARETGLRIRTASLARLGHPMSVDLFVERTVAGSGAIAVRILGGLDRWRYGAEELAAACRRHGTALALLRGDAPVDARLLALSSVPAEACRRLDAMLREGGAENARRALRLAAFLAGRAPDPAEAPLVRPRAGRHTLGPAVRNPAGRAAIVFYRSHLHAEDTAPLEALATALGARGIATDGLFVDSLKAPGTAAFVAETLATTRPDVVLNATAFSARDAAGRSPLAAAGRPVLQLVVAGSDEAAWRASARGLAPADLAMSVVLPEIDGTLATPLLGCKAETVRGRLGVAVAGGAEAVADRVAGLVRLGRTPAASRRIAIVLSDYPGAAGTSHARGHAVGLDTWESLADILALLAAHGYATETPPATALAAGTREGALRLGNVLVALQPGRAAPDGDRRTSYHDPNTAPGDAYAAFYRSLRAEFGAHAIVHLGTHGTLEWLPGKAAALSAGCLPAALIGGTPVVYPFIVNNPGEAAVAKRRLGAVAIGHLTPPLIRATLAGDAARVEALLDELAAADGLDRRRAGLLRREVLDRATASGLLAEAGCTGSDETDALARLDAYLCDVKELRIGDGLHVFGRAHPGAAALLDDVGAAHAEALGASPAAERAALLAALDGRFVAPGPAGAPGPGRADVLPTGRNLVAIDPRQAPTRTAFALARRNAELLLLRHGQEHGEPLARLVLDLWGSATLRTGGEDLALAFVLLGATPVHDAAGRMTGVELLSVAELRRPRVDVTLRVSGVFRDNFAGQIALYDRAVRRVAARDEDPADNPLVGAAGPRVFGPAPGAFGVGREAWIAGSAWAYGTAEAAPAPDALAAIVAAADAFLHAQDHAGTDILDGPEHAAHEGGFALAAAAAGRRPALYHAELGPAPRVRLAREEIARVVRGRLANPAWLAGMRRHGMRGASEMARGTEALADFARSLPDRFDAQFDLLATALLGDAGNVAFLEEANPEALRAIRATLEAVHAEGLWHPRRNDPAGDA